MRTQSFRLTVFPLCSPVPSVVKNFLCALCVLCGSDCIWPSPTAAARGFYADSFSGTQANAELAGGFFRRTVTPDDQGAAGSGVGSASQAVGPAGTAVG